MFDLSDEIERFICERIRQMHTGRWPLFRAYAMRRVGSVVYEVAEWRPQRPRRLPVSFSLLSWDLRQPGLRWRDCPTLTEARKLFASTVSAARSADLEPANGSSPIRLW